jgi:hypothetical protein
MIYFILLHVLEIVGLLFYMLIRKNRKLEEIITEQQQYLDSINIVIKQSEDKLKELDDRGIFEADDEVGFFFTNIKEIQSILNDFTIKN